MEEIIYSDGFYVNEFLNKGINYGKSHVEVFMRKPPKNLVQYLEKQNHFGKDKGAFQAVIIGEPRVSLFGKPQAAVLIVHSNFIAYTTTSDYAAPGGVTYGYATFDNEIAVSKTGNQLEMQTPYEAFLFGVESLSKEKDYQIVEALLDENAAAVSRYFEELKREEEEVVQELEEELAEENQEASEIAEDEQPSIKEVSTPEPTVDETIPETREDASAETAEVFVTATDDGQASEQEQTENAEETTNDLPVEAEKKPLVPDETDVSKEPEEEDELPAPEMGAAPLKMAEADENLPVEEPAEPAEEMLEADDESTDGLEKEPEEEWGHVLMQKNAEGDLEEMKHLPAEMENQLPAEQSEEVPAEATDNSIDSRFQTEQPIISHNDIPKGFVFSEPVIYAYSVRPGLLKTVTPRAGYMKAYENILDEIKEDIEDGRFDAVFNLQITTQSVENYFDVVVSGDAVLFDE